MPAVADDDTLEQFRLILARRIGLGFADHKQSELRDAFMKRLAALRIEPSAYLERVASNTQELSELAPLLTIPETYFFRNRVQLDACMEVAVPTTQAARAEPGVRILSAACASGEEPYTLAILLRERQPAIAPASTILAIDLNPAVLERARRAQYSAWSLRETSSELRERYFRPRGQDYLLEQAVRDAVRFEQLNLVDPNPLLLPEQGFDIVFCRNVLMYFTPDQFAAAIGRLARALVPDGYLFLGHAETLRGVSDEFHLCHTHEAFYYRKKSPGARRPRSQRPAQPAARPAERSQLAGARVPHAWFEEIQRAGKLVAGDGAKGAAVTTTQTATATAPATTVVATAATATTAGAAAGKASLLELLRRERFTDALVVIRAARAVTAPGPADVELAGDGLLLEAVVSAHAGEFVAARALCRELLETDELNAGAQYVLALCHEGGGDSELAIYHHQLSAYLDPSFAMPRVHLGLLWRRKGELAASRSELREARSLLEREDASRVLLFGGGFNRAALLALCEAELSGPSR